MLEMTRAAVEAVSGEDPALFIETAKREIGRNTMSAHAAALAAKGRTTIAEAMRISSQFAD